MLKRDSEYKWLLVARVHPYICSYFVFTFFFPFYTTDKQKIFNAF